MPDMTPSPAAEWKAANRKTVTLPSGRSVLIRKLTGEFILVIRGLFERALEAGERGQTLRLEVKDQREYIRALVMEAVIAPKVVADTVPPTDDTLQISDFGPDLDPLVAEINKFNEEILVLPFRSQEVGADAAQGGDGVRPDAGGVLETVAAGSIVQSGSAERSDERGSG